MNLCSYAKVPLCLGRPMLKIIIVMKLIFFIITIACVQVSAIGYAQHVNIQQKEAMLTNVFSTIERQTGYSFFWKNEDLTKIKIDVKLQNASLEEALKEVFKGLPYTYAVVKNSIVIQPKETTFIDRVVAAFTGIDIKGAVLDRQGQPLPGATITLKGTQRSTSTNIKGEFSLANVPKDAVLQVSYMGYVTRDVIVTGDYVGVLMELSTSKLDEVQVMAYGTTNRRLATGNIGTVTAKEIEKQPVMNPLLALAGRVPGVVVTSPSGYASGIVKVEIRGRSSINSGFTSEPLYIIDGVPLTYLEIGGVSSYELGSSGILQNGSFGTSGGQSPLFNLNPADISSIEVLKDADATAIYGSRGANGVILITTKKGKPGATVVTADISQGINKVTRYWDLLSTKDYLQMRREAFKNDGIVPTALNAPDLVLWDSTRYTNWQKELWGGTGQLTKSSIALSGGNDNTQFRIAGNFTRQKEILTASGSNKSGNAAFNLINKSLNSKFKINFSVNYSYTDVNTIAVPGSVTLAPNAPAIYNNEGELNFEGWSNGTTQSIYPFSSLKQPASSKTTLVTSNLNISYELFKGFDISSNFGYNNSHNSMETTIPISSQDPKSNPTGVLGVGTNDNQNWIIEPQLNYQTTIGKGRFTALLGASLQSTSTAGQTISGLGYTDDSFLGSIQLAPTLMTTDKLGQYKYAAIFGRLNYTWDDKYIVNFSGRRDGSSRFGPGNQYGNFGAIGLAWIASQENWIKSVLPSYVSFIKLRGSYGITGSDNVGDYRYLTEWTNMAPGYVPIYSYGGITPLVSQHAVNPNYQWQVNKKLEGGINVSFLDDRINLEAAYYQNRCDNQLTLIPTPMFTGFGDVTANWEASVQNSGWEFSATARLISNKNFTWSLNLNGGSNKNVLLSYPNILQSPYAKQYLVGQSINMNYLLHYIGVDPLTGQYVFEDYNHDGQIGNDGLPGTGYSDRNIALSLDPKFSGGIGSEFQYKDWQFSFFFQYRNQMARNPLYGGFIAGGMTNISVEMFKNRWTTPGQQAEYARFTTAQSAADGNVNTSDRAYTDGSYLRLNNVSLSYTLPKSIIKGNTQLRFFMNAQNLWLISGYPGIDPDMQSFGGMPSAKVITGGLSLTL
ncbi:TonB-linked outer membrane protein, SusC/RagA family [Pedobacter caeni]|uniref:TonB-linked outer membrane protein, SusC/RagA family n=2 Tax=Pedobacter caeni TaxID=288992 RepID=A0A1M5DE77_9SPHI|nr:TonB-linked outer membrane protein, SusC/RagA family [Pedobacter caeni]